MGQDSTATEQPAGSLTPRRFSAWRTARYLVELLLLSGMKGEPPPSQLLIVAPTLQDARGIFQEASAYISSIALQAQSNGDSND